jgi:hypothetical protein
LTTEVQGTEIESSDGQLVGDIDRLMIDTDHGYVAYGLIARGGMLGGAGEWIPALFKALRWSPQRHYTLTRRAADQTGARPAKAGVSRPGESAAAGKAL